MAKKKKKVVKKKSPRLDPNRTGSQLPKKKHKRKTAQQILAEKNDEAIKKVDPDKLSVQDIVSAAYTSDKAGPFALLTNPKQRAFLTAYVLTGSVKESAKVVDITTHAHYKWLARNKAYADLFSDAITLAARAMLEPTMLEQAIEGKKRYKFHQGEPVMWINPETGKMEHYAEVEHNVKQQEIMLRSNLPDKYVEKKEVKTETEVNIDVNVVDTEQLKLLNDIVNQSSAKDEEDIIDVDPVPKLPAPEEED